MDGPVPPLLPGGVAAVAPGRPPHLPHQPRGAHPEAVAGRAREQPGDQPATHPRHPPHQQDSSGAAAQGFPRLKGELI